MLFGHATIAQLNHMMECLNSFVAISGLKINLNKSKLFAAPCVLIGVASMLSRISNIPRTTDLGRYLGVPAIHGRVATRNYRFILEKMESRLAAWKRSTLSLTGRCTLIKSVTSSIPIYNMQTMILPVSVCKSIDRLNRDYLWGSDQDKRKTHHVKWSTICLSKNKGGLGLRKAKDQNLAQAAKMGWRIAKRDPTPWCEALTQKYTKNALFGITLDCKMRRRHSERSWTVASFFNMVLCGEPGMEPELDSGKIDG